MAYLWILHQLKGNNSCTTDVIPANVYCPNMVIHKSVLNFINFVDRVLCYNLLNLN